MRTLVRIMLMAVCAGAPVSVWASDRDKALAVIEQAIKAHGGAEALTKAQTRLRGGRGMGAITNNVPFNLEETFHLPDQDRLVVRVGAHRMIIVLNGDKGWQVPFGGAAQQIGKEMLQELREEPYVLWLATLVPLQKGGFDLMSLPDAKVNGQDAAVVKVSRKDHRDVSLFFDKKTSLLIKIRRRAKEASVAYDKEYSYSDYKDYDGVKLPSTEVIAHNGKKVSEVKFTSYKLLSKIEESTFSKP
jgi:hypothetical protein